MPWTAVRTVAPLIALFACLGSAARGAPGDSLKKSQARAPLDTPRGSFERFLDRCRQGDFAGASAFLDLPADEHDGARLARQLKALLDRTGLDTSRISAVPGGDVADGLPANVDAVHLTGPDGPWSLRLQAAEDGSRWLVSRETLQQVGALYATIDNGWLLERLPAPLLRQGPRGLLWWQWIALLPLVLATVVLGNLLGRLTIAIVRPLAKRTSLLWDDLIVERMQGPVKLAWALAVLFAAFPFLDPSPAGEASLQVILRALVLVAFFWSLLRLVEVGRQFLASGPWAVSNPASRSLLQLGTRVAKVGVVAIAAVAVISELGYPVASLLAGLGIGGLAVALAAQKTLENVLGAFAISFDQPFREGDFVHVEDFVGTVETIGLRSTRIRTLDRTLITIPNGRLSDMRLESFSVRDRLRLACTVGLEYGTTAEQMKEVLAGLEGVLRRHPRIWPDAVVVRFKEFGASSLDIEVMAWFLTSDWSQFQLIRQDVLLQFMAVVEAAGCSFAFPSTTVHLASVPETLRLTPGGPASPPPSAADVV